MKSPWLMVCALLAGVSGGCGRYEAPRLSVADVAVGERTSDGVLLTFTLDAENVNSVPLPLRDVRYVLRLDGERVFEGYRSAEATLRRFGTQQLTLPAVVAIEDADALRGEVDYELTGRLMYVTPGEIAEILFDSGVRRPKVSFRDRGRVSIATE